MHVCIQNVKRNDVISSLIDYIRPTLIRLQLIPLIYTSFSFFSCYSCCCCYWIEDKREKKYGLAATLTVMVL